MKKFVIIFSLCTFLWSPLSSVYPSMSSAYLCEIGMKYYKAGRYNEALEEFKKALIVDPHYEPALNYIQMIEQMGVSVEGVRKAVISPFEPVVPAGVVSPQETGDIIELQQEMVKAKGVRQAPSAAPVTAAGKKQASLPQIVSLDEFSTQKAQQPLQIQQGQQIVFEGNNIFRFLVTQAGVVAVEQKSADELLLSGKDIGYTYVHVWDENGRWTIEVLGILPRPEGLNVDELRRLEEEKAGTFKVRYSLDWSSFAQGRRINTLERQSFSWYHNLDLDGPTPYGRFSSGITVRDVENKNDLTYFSTALTEGRLGPFKDFTLRGGDFYPDFNNLAFGGISGMRGAMLASPAFDKKLKYTAFWGREGGGRYGDLSPGLQKTQSSFVNGFNVNYYLNKSLDFGLTAVHGYGLDRPDYLHDYAYDANSNWHLGPWGLGYEAAYDTQELAYLLKGNYNKQNLNFNYELRDINKDFLTISGETWRRGERGGLFFLQFAPVPSWNIAQRLDVFQDRLFPAEDNPDGWNEDYNFDAYYTIDPVTGLRMNYILQNELGKLSQTRYQNWGIGGSRSVHWIRDINTYIDLHHQESKSYTAHSSDYVNDNISTGVRFSLIGQLYYYLTKQWNWLTESATGVFTRPNALETGVELNSQILNTPFYENIRFMYRDEEDTMSTLSFLSGEDYIEGYAELSYRPTPDQEAYCSTRIRNVWAESPLVQKRMEADFNAGMRYLWDTGVRWESIGSIEGYVFNDLNSDGLRQRDEAPIEGVKVWLGKTRSGLTDIFGYYQFKGVKGKNAHVGLDVTTLPSGFVLTVPDTQEINIEHGRSARVDFGMASRSEISGIVFEDKNDNNEYEASDKGIAGAVVTLENGAKSTTDESGRYLFSNAPIGEHVITLDINSLPVNYLPKSALTKKITLFEGVMYAHSFPLKKIQQ